MSPVNPELRGLPWAHDLPEYDFDRIGREGAAPFDDEDASAELARLPSRLFDQDEVLVRVVRRADYALDARQSGATQEIVLANAVDVSWLRRVSLVVLLHSIGAWRSTTAQAWVAVTGTRLTEEEPDVAIVSREEAISPMIQSTSVAPGCTVTPVPGTVGPQARVSLKLIQGAVAADAPQPLAISVFLIGRAR